MLRKTNIALRSLSALGAAAAVGPGGGAWARDGADHGWMMWDSDFGWRGIMGGGIGMVLFWGLIILLVVLVVRGLGGFGSRRDSIASNEKTPLQILQERYARGEIDKEEYDERRKTLTG